MNKDNIRNFAIIAHIDHGKSTLSDRLLELTNTIEKQKMREQFLDQNPISRERGITIKLAPVRMQYQSKTKTEDITANEKAAPSNTFILNLIDTPGHVDFSYEVSRTLAACEGAVLLVDATAGIQAQTVAHFTAAKKEGLVIIPVINKIDLPNAQTDIVKNELVYSFGFKVDDIITISAKSGEGVPMLLSCLIDKIPYPKGDLNGPLRALIFDGIYDEYRGVVTYVKIVDGEVKTGDEIVLYQNQVKAIVTEVGYFAPFLMPSACLKTGEIGYIITGIKDIRKARIGDTIVKEKDFHSEKDFSDNGFKQITPLPGYSIPKPMVFFGLYPKKQDDFPKLKESLNKLVLNDTSISFTQEYSSYLGSGFRTGFLGLLHADIIKQRLKQEFGLDLLLTMPQVLYQKQDDGSILEPYMLLSVYVPKAYVGAAMSVCQKKKGNLLDMTYHDAYGVLTYEMPYSMFIRGLTSDLKSVTSGFASIDYEIGEYKEADLVQLQILINSNEVDVLSELVYKDEATYIARIKAAKLKESLPRQQFKQVIQVSANGQIIAREEISPFRKDVIQKLYGGDRTRKDKLLEAQKKGKKRMLVSGKINIPQEAFYSLIEK